MNDVRRQLIVYERNGRILKWHDRMIPAGTEWRCQIDRRLEAAQVVLLFMSPHFIESQYCYEVEGEVALRRHETGEARVVPIVLRPCAWEATPFGALQALPADARPISRWTDRDEACLDAARGVMRVVDELIESRGALLSSEPLVSAAASGAAPPQTTRMAAATDSKLVYCRRCGRTAGERSACTGQYNHHEFVPGVVGDYCARCGVRPGIQTVCTGQYTHHVFVSSTSRLVICSRCGVSPGAKTICTGQYTHHAFAEM